MKIYLAVLAASLMLIIGLNAFASAGPKLPSEARSATSAVPQGLEVHARIMLDFPRDRMAEFSRADPNEVASALVALEAQMGMESRAIEVVKSIECSGPLPAVDQLGDVVQDLLRACRTAEVADLKVRGEISCVRYEWVGEQLVAIYNYKLDPVDGPGPASVVTPGGDQPLLALEPVYCALLTFQVR